MNEEEVRPTMCGDAYTDRGDEHHVYLCELEPGHRSAHMDLDYQATWTDAEHHDLAGYDG